ncbi:unnamed protein product [Nippostrongylus brasiliensis]|uniref:Cytoplasmic tRNA 2-thiolation protein 2 n=1 Tax=Nippostrongylus brasiliensis TaxID=27835 RepID=A0A0N4XFG8_NIPBR|nr:unnamed protein product [Nippostrongylus brasiliensis]
MDEIDTHTTTPGRGKRFEECAKCTEEAVHVSTTTRTAYCSSCFVKMVKAKFRSSLSKQKIFRGKDTRRALVVVDGSTESAYLFRQIEDSVKQTNFKRLMIEPSFLVILSSTNELEVKAVQNKLSILREALPSCSFYLVHLAAVFEYERVENDGTCHGFRHVQKLTELCSSIETVSSREEVLRLLRIRLIQQIAKDLGLSKIVVASNSDELAQLAISQLCLGRGGAVSEMTNVIENTAAGVTFIRPLRDVSTEEATTALRLENVEHYAFLPNIHDQLSSVSYAYEAGTKGSIQLCVSRFIRNLFNDGFKGTAPNILGAVSKVHDQEGSALCTLCGYSFSSQGSFCYVCSSIVNDFPASSLPILLGERLR